MAITTIGGSINSTAVLPNLDYKYGPYNSLQEAYDALGPEGADKLVVGLTVGIIQQGGGIVEYWFKDGTNFEDLVMKIGGSNEVDYQGLINKPSINSVVLSGNKTASDLDLYTKPATGIPSTDLSSAVQTSLGKADISVSNTVNDLVNYYLKTETYTQTEVNNLIGAIHQFHFEVYPNLASVTDPSSNVLYLIGPSGSGSDMYEEYVYANSNFVKIGDTSIDLSGYVTTTDLNTALTSYTTTTDLQTYYAQKDGEYNELHSGYTKWIEGNNSITDPDALFTYRPSHNNFITQYGVVEALKGNSVAWNQLIKNGNFVNNSSWTVTAGASMATSDNVATLTCNSSITSSTRIEQDIALVANHVYMLYIGIMTQKNLVVQFVTDGMDYFLRSESIPSGAWRDYQVIKKIDNNAIKIRFYVNAGTSLSDGDIVNFRNIEIIDLTLLGIDTYTVAEVDAWLASNIGLRDYYPYNPGEIINCKVQGIKTIGFNQWDEEWENGYYSITDGGPAGGTDRIRSKNYIKVFPNTTYYIKLPSGVTTRVYYHDIDKNFISCPSALSGLFTTPVNCYYIHFSPLATYGTTYNHDICINLSWSGTKNDTYEPYWTETKEFDVTKIYGKLNGEGELVQVFAGGMRKAGTTKDALYVENGVTKAKVNVGYINLGTPTWTAVTHVSFGNYFKFVATSLGIKRVGSFSTTVYPLICTKYKTVNREPSVFVDKTITVDGDVLNVTEIQIKDSEYNDATVFKTSLNGVYLNYELATPLTYTNLVYRDNGTDTPLVLPFNYRVDDYGSEEQVMPTPVNDEITSCACYLDLEYDVVRGIDFIKDTSDRLSDIDNNIQDLRVPVISQVPVSGMLPNVVYNLGTLGSNTTFTLATPTDNTILNHWYWTFNIGSTIPTIVWPSGIIWAGDNLSPIIEANKHYEVSVINNIGTYIYSVVI